MAEQLAEATGEPYCECLSTIRAARGHVDDVGLELLRATAGGGSGYKATIPAGDDLGEAVTPGDLPGISEEGPKGSGKKAKARSRKAEAAARVSGGPHGS